jgi:hypothetical protein
MPKEPAAVTSAKVNRTATIMVAILALIGVLVTAYLQYANRPSQSPDTEYVGRVLDANTLQPIAGAKITLDLEGVPPIVYTDSEGVYRFKVQINSDISGQIRVDALDYQVYLRNITISRDRTRMEDIRLTP